VKPRADESGVTRPPELVGVSGGRDSVVLLDWLCQQAGTGRLVVCHMNHGLRGHESGRDAAFTRRLAARLGLECVVARVNVRALAGIRRVSFETAARDARLQFFRDTAKSLGASTLWLAHHAEDQAETVLANACRGAGLSGLGAMREISRLDDGLEVRRPLLRWRRAEIDAWLEARGLPFREDASNSSPAHRRNRLRHEALPLLDAIFDRDVSGNLARLAELAARDEDFLEQLAADWLAPPGRVDETGGLRADKALRELHPSLLARVLRRWLRDRGAGRLPERATADVMNLLAPGSGPRTAIPGGLMVHRKAGWLRLGMVRGAGFEPATPAV
jgi:tRNA(Ile)-lysidine synthase